jgi:hypothetical protein
MLTLEELKNDSDWQTAFTFASGQSEGSGTHSDPTLPEWVAGDVHTGQGEPARIGDVVEVIAEAQDPPVGSDGRQGYYDLEMWLVAKLADGRFLFLQAGCDTTGWGCRDGGRSYCATSLERLMIAITPAEKTQLGLVGSPSESNEP